MRVFSEIVGDLPISEYGKDEIIDFNTLILRLPANFGKSSRDKRSARQVIEDLDELEPQNIADIVNELQGKNKTRGEIEEAVAKEQTLRISATTVKRHQTALQGIFAYAHRKNAIGSNPFKGRVLSELDVKRMKKYENRYERVRWGDGIYDLFSSQIFTEPLTKIGEPLFWAPIVSVYTGLRLQEICQLRLRDFGKEEGHYFVAVQNAIGSQNI
ncbi:hypothetical protein LC612_42230 [Nostoc sp. CHAB 5834]|nr:hypothetical protein [Nostoc sp. CHAB 5834]